ncbi:response regulator [Niveibacterium sp. 24ML]|uniref:tetratricopeptide repeat protein n=1 Tax=Niveibacterium sp. 24ML TaxID=2985512 RepID=UPI00226E8CF1|nr:tetratricopeptide repeat protein [Niveibacterium sp. 24ML]MCX9156841.1 response regulator [Niveibacterium sp. 24ML]
MAGKVEDLTVLVVENQSNMRTQLRNMLAMCGITKLEAAQSAGAAIRKLRDSSFDIILCEYHLGEGQDGQHFLEDIRHHHLIPLYTLFIMVTGERSYERVVGAAELAPNDYILKPFAPDLLRTRLERALNKREAFMPTWQLIEAGNAADAIAACQEGELKYPVFAIDFQRLHAELLITTGRAEEAQAVYEKVLARRAVPWANLGLAKALFMRKRYEEAETQLVGLLNESEQYLDAWDWLAKTREAVGALVEARQALERAAELSPHTLRRMRHIGEVALELGDLEAAERTLNDVVRKAKYSDFRDPEDHVKLVKAQLGVGAPDRATATLRDLDRSMQGLPKTELCKALSSAMVYTHQGEADKATEAAERAAGLLDARLGVSTNLKKDLAKVCIEHKLESQAADVVMDIMRHAADDSAVDGITKMLDSLGRADMGSSLAQQMKTEVRDMMGEGARMAQRGDFEGAVTHMLEAVRRMPGNTMVLYNAALALLKYIENCGWDAHYAEQSRGLIARLQKVDPGNPKLGALHLYFDGLAKRFGAKG